MVRVLKKQKALPDFLLSGTPERTLTSDLSLRRRSLYTTELLGHMPIFYPYFSVVSRKSADFLPLHAYTVWQRFGKERKEMYESGKIGADLDDLIFEKDAGGPSER